MTPMKIIYIGVIIFSVKILVILGAFSNQSNITQNCCYGNTHYTYHDVFINSGLHMKMYVITYSMMSL